VFLGKFQYRVTTKGEYSYWSGYTDLYEIVYYRGTLVVEDRQSFDGEVTLKVAKDTKKKCNPFHSFKNKYLSIKIFQGLFLPM
jgi:hypothetical protein